MAASRPKLTRGLLRTLGQVERETEALPIIVAFQPNRRVTRGQWSIHGLRTGYHYHLRPFAQMQATPGAIMRLEGDPDVLRIYQDLPVQAFLDYSVPHVRVPRLWEEGLTGEGVRIAVVDTGIDQEHPDLAGRILATRDLTGEGVRDLNGHGTHCASIAAGTGEASGGRYKGVAPAASLYIAKVLDATGNGMMSGVMAGVEWAVDQGVQVISLSLGSVGPCDGTDALSEMCDAAVEAGVAVVCAAGNEGPAPYTVGSPGCARQVITIGAASNLDRMASFSSRGPTRDGRLKPDVVLPGVEIVAARAKGTRMGTVVDDYYTAASGTSMATPHAAGICALLLQAEPGLTPAELKERLTRTAISIGADAYAQGMGRVDAWRAMQNELSPEVPLPEPPLPAPAPAPGAGCLAPFLRWFPRRR